MSTSRDSIWEVCPHYRAPDYETLASEVGAVDLFINTPSFTMPCEIVRALR